MSSDFSETKAVCFDLGNTLIEFGPRQIAMQYERLTAKLVEMFGSCDGEKLKEWFKVKSGFAPLAIGSRSAIFAPLDELGLIIMDEEHEWTYKQESSPYYQTHKVAEMLMEIADAKFVMGTATPRIETLHKSRVGDYDYVR